jgi:hypothetical protein
MKPVTIADFQALNTSHAAAKLYMQTLRTDCLKDQYDKLKDIITSGYLKFNAEDKTFIVPEGLKAL